MMNRKKSLVHVLNHYPRIFNMLPLQKKFLSLYARIIMSKIYHVIVISTLLLLFLSCSPTQQIGKVFTNTEAYQQFGAVIYSSEVPREKVIELLNKTEKTIMFGLVNKIAIILDNNRKLLYPAKAEYTDTDVFTAYNISSVKELLSKSNSQSLVIEQRREVLSVSLSNYTLETGWKCPPNCPEN